MRTIETKVYTFDELSDSAKEKALDNHRYSEVEDLNWWDWTYDDFIQRASFKGYSILPKDIHFSGFSSQGDGACFAGNVRKTSEETIALMPCDLAAEIKLHHAKCRLFNIDPINLELTARVIHGSSNYCHSNTMEIVETHIEDENWGRCNMGPCFCSPNWPDVCDERDELLRKLGLINFDHILREEAKELADELYKSLGEEHDYRTSDEFLSEMLGNRDTEFTEDGEAI